MYPEKEGEPVHFYPGPAGAKEWTHAAYNPETEPLLRPGAGYRGDGHAAAPGVQGEHPLLGRGRSCGLRGHDGVRQRVRCLRRREVAVAQPSFRCARRCSPRPATWCSPANPRGEFNAFDARTGELLWQFQCGSGHHSSPTTYSIDGRQYIAVPVGWGAWVEGFLPGMLGAGHGCAMFVFALPEE